MRLIWLPLTLVLACSGQAVEDPNSTKSKTPTTDAGELGANGGEAATGANGKPPSLNTDQMNDARSGQQPLQMPSPKEMTGLLKDKVQMELPARKGFTHVEKDDELAVQTGVLLADLVLTVDESTTEEKVKYLEALKKACERLEVGSDIPANIADIIDQVRSERLVGLQLKNEFDQLNGVMVPELEKEGAAWLVPLVQAGSWLEGAHLVSKAFDDETDPAKLSLAQEILRQPGVVGYFQGYVNQRAEDTDLPGGVIDVLNSTLDSLASITAKETWTKADITEIRDRTGNVLALLK